MLRATRTHRLTVLAGVLLGLVLDVVEPAAALPPPTELVVPAEGARPHIRGEEPPPPGKRLGLPARTPRRTTPEPAPKPRGGVPGPRAAGRVEARPAARPLPTIRRPPTRRRRARTLRLLLDTGRALLPRAALTAAAGFDRLPALVGQGLDFTLLRPVNERHAYGLRVGLTMPDVPAANWSSSTREVGALWHDLHLAFVDIALAYLYRRPLLGPLGLLVRLGAGLDIAAGHVDRAETLPVCPGHVATCPHWKEVGRHGSELPSPIWPSLRATAGLYLNLGRGFGLHLDAGLRDVLYAGGGLSFSR